MIETTELKIRNQMFVCDLTQLNPQIQQLIKFRKFESGGGFYDVTKLIDYLNRKFNKNVKGEKNKQLFVAIVHNMDVKRGKDGKVVIGKDGKPILRAPHLHIGRHSPNSTTLKSFAKAMLEPKERVETCQNIENFEKHYGQHNWENLVSYLFHRSKRAKEMHKYQYPFNWGAGNFDFQTLIKIATENAEKAGKKRKSKAYELREQNAEQEELAKKYSELILKGQVQFNDYPYIDELKVARLQNRKLLEDSQDIWAHTVHNFYQQWKRATIAEASHTNQTDRKSSAYWSKKLKELNFQPQTSINFYFCGAGGSGKTALAEFVAGTFDDKNRPRGVCIAGGEKNQFESFENQYALVLDDLRPQTFPPERWTQLLDPNTTVRQIAKRYHNGIATNLKTVCLTNTQPLDEFVRFIKNKGYKDGRLVEPEGQYFRRFEGVFDVGPMEYRKSESLEYVEGIITYDYYEIRHVVGFGDAVRKNRPNFNSAYDEAKRKGFKTLKIYYNDADGDRVGRTSDYYLLRTKKDQTIVLPITRLQEATHKKESIQNMWNELSKQEEKPAKSEQTELNADVVKQDDPFADIPWVMSADEKKEFMQRRAQTLNG